MPKGNPDWSYQSQPVEGAVFTVSGTVDANITNSEINANVTNSSFDVNVTNSSLDVNVQGTADVQIQNAQVNVQTVREQASAAGNVFYASDIIHPSELTADNYVKTLYTNDTGENVYLEQILNSLWEPHAKTNGPIPAESIDAEIRVMAPGTAFPDDPVVAFPFNWTDCPVNFDPSIPLPPNYSIELLVSFDDYLMSSSYNYRYTVTVVLRR